MHPAAGLFHIQAVDEAQVVDIDRDFRVKDGSQGLDHPRLQARGRGRGRGRGGGLLGLVYQIENFHRVHSVETGRLASRSAAFSVCQARVAHFTRTGNSRTPASTSSLPSATAGGASPPPATSA